MVKWEGGGALDILFSEISGRKTDHFKLNFLAMSRELNFQRIAKSPDRNLALGVDSRGDEALLAKLKNI